MNIKRVKISNYGLILIVVFFGMSSCDLVSLDDPIAENEQAQEDTSDKVTGPNTVPTTVEGFQTILSGEVEKMWSGEAFTLAGFDGFQDCRLDDQVVINVDGSYKYDGGSDLCGAEDNQQNREGTWRITNDKGSIVFDEGTDRQYEASIVGLSQDSLTISGSYLGLDVNGLYIAK